MVLINFIVNLISITFFTIISVFFPILGFLTPSYKLNYIDTTRKSLREKIFLNVILISILFFIDKSILIYYLIFPFALELYFIFSSKIYRVFNIDSILIGSIVVSSLILLLIYLYHENIIKFSEFYLNYAYTKMTYSKDQIDFLVKQFNIIKSNIIYLVFFNVFIANIFLNITVFKNYFKYYKLSPYWLIIFISVTFIEKVIKIENTYTYNLIECIKLVYIIYGVKSLYEAITKDNKFRYIAIFFCIVASLYYPIIIFVYGAYKSFNINFKFKIIGGE